MFILLGLGIGFIAAVPVGPVNVVVISQTLKRDFFHGVLAGSTAAALDICLCLIALVGFFKFKISVSAQMISGLKAAASLVLLYIARRLIMTSRTFSIPSNSEKVPPATHRPIVSVLALYLSNPTIYAFWFAVGGAVTGHNLVRNNGWTPVAFAAACGVGSMCWYLLLTRFLSTRQSKIRQETIRKAFFAMATILIGFAIYSVGTIIF